MYHTGTIVMAFEAHNLSMLSPGSRPSLSSTGNDCTHTLTNVKVASIDITRQPSPRVINETLHPLDMYLRIHTWYIISSDWGAHGSGLLQHGVR